MTTKWLIWLWTNAKRLNVSAQQVHSIVGTPGRLKGVLTWVIFVPARHWHLSRHFPFLRPIINELAKQHDDVGIRLPAGPATDQAEIDTIITALSALAADCNTVTDTFLTDLNNRKQDFMDNQFTQFNLKCRNHYGFRRDALYLQNQRRFNACNSNHQRW